MTDTEQTAHDLESARAAMDSQGLTRGAMSDDEGQVCLLGALHVVTGQDIRRYSAARAALDAYVRQAYATELPGDTFSAPAHVNDHLLRDKQDAMDVLAKAAVAAREGDW